MLSLSGLPDQGCVAAPIPIRSSTGEPGLFLCAHRRARSPTGLPGHAIQRPNALKSGPIPARFSRPRSPRIRADKPFTRCLNRQCGVVVLEPIWDDRRGPKTHSRRTGRKLGQLRCARQGLVRVPKSNTKYGGKRGKTGGDAAPVIDPSISESSGFPREKNCSVRPVFHLRPLFTGELFIRRPGLHFGDSCRPTESSPDMPADRSPRPKSAAGPVSGSP